ncbi:MAG: hypothetical protein M1819_001485 [Sarea resinae]|nr:MAG: hypothetical protein M1819_001485 [Sarea resinae]
MPDQSWTEIAAIAQTRRAASIPPSYLLPESLLSDLPKNLTTIPKTSRHFSTDELEIIETPAEEILVKIREKTWTALKVTEAFCKAAAVAQQMTNCLTEILFPEALKQAQFLDEYLEKNGSVIGPLHGLPISLKDSFVTPPHPSSCGLIQWANAPTKPEEESLLVQVVRRLGAVYYVKTNVPPGMMMMDTLNNAWGATRNPLNPALSAGGSSGGEAALIAMRGSPLGVGTDIGGSIRMPSAFNNLYGLKPSSGRFPTWHGRSAIPGQDFVRSVNGPMSRSLNMLQLYCEAVLSESVAPWTLDAKCLPIPWRKHVIQPKGRKLRVGIVGNNDGLVTTHPPVERALALTRQCLEAAGHEVFEWQPIEHPEIVKHWLATFLDVGSGPLAALLTPSGEPIYGSLKAWVAAAAQAEQGLGPTKMRMINLKRDQLQEAYLTRWQQTANGGKGPMDCIIMAASPWAVPRLGLTAESPYFGYTAAFNLLDYPVCTFPVTFAHEKLDPKKSPGSFTPLSEIDAQIQADYDPSFYDGAPVSLQLVGGRLEEEKVLEMVGVVADLLEKEHI